MAKKDFVTSKRSTGSYGTTSKASASKSHSRGKNKSSLFKSGWFWLAVVVVLLIGLRLALPSILRLVINDELADLGDYHGAVSDVELAIWRGNYAIEGVTISKVQPGGTLQSPPFVAIDRVDFSIDWQALLDRRIESSILVDHPVVYFTDLADAKDAKDKSKELANKKASDETGDDAADSKGAKHKRNWQDKLRALAPFQINHFEIADGLVRFRDDKTQPPIKLDISKISLSIANISNTLRSADQLPTAVTLQALVMKSGELKANAKLNLLQKPLEGQFKIAVRGFQLAEINTFARAFGKFDFKSGTLDVTAELAASKSRYEGYVKTLMKKVDVLNWKEERKNGASLGHLLWEGVVGTIVDIFKNHKKDQFAARLPLAGPRSDLEINKWSSVGSILRNGFIRALSPKFDDDVSFKDVSDKKAPAAPPKSPK